MKERVDEIMSKLEFESDDNGKEYEVEAIRNSEVYAKELDSGHLSGFYYLVS